MLSPPALGDYATTLYKNISSIAMSRWLVVIISQTIKQFAHFDSTEGFIEILSTIYHKHCHIFNENC
jgi:hypothetical protein